MESCRAGDVGVMSGDEMCARLGERADGRTTERGMSSEISSLLFSYALSRDLVCGFTSLPSAT
jgi:hypothetical protein